MYMLIQKGVIYKFEVRHRRCVSNKSNYKAETCSCALHIVNSIPPNIQDVSRLEDITAGGDFLGLCDQNSNSRTRPRVNRVLRKKLASDVLNLVAYLLHCQHYFCHLTRAVHNRAAACVAAGGGIFENQL
jgi:hypothetical protein